jgi:armadillo repeat-containing protein 7
LYIQPIENLQLFPGIESLCISSSISFLPSFPVARLHLAMFQSHSYLAARTGKSGTDRFTYLQSLVSEFQQTSPAPSIRAQEEILAHLANFAYDPGNYEHLRRLNVIPDLLLDALSDGDSDGVLLRRFAMGGICNCCLDPLNRTLLVDAGGLELIVQCLECTDDDETVAMALSSIWMLRNALHCTNAAAEMPLLFSQQVQQRCLQIQQDTRTTPRIHALVAAILLEPTAATTSTEVVATSESSSSSTPS